MILLDTDILIDNLRGYTPAQEYFNTKVSQGEEFTISIITIGEIYAGTNMKDAEIAKKTSYFLDMFIPFGISIAIAQKAGEIVRLYNVPLLDAFIAATAIIHDLKLVSRNEKHFSKVKGLKFAVPYS